MDAVCQEQGDLQDWPEDCSWPWEHAGQGPVRRLGGLQDHVCHGFLGQAQRQGLSHCGPGERRQQHRGGHRRGPQDPEATAGGCIQK